VALVKQQAYARQVQSRRPAKPREIKPSRQSIELVCFLRVTLLELTDVALLQSSRRSQQPFREAADRAQANRTQSATGVLKQAAQANAVLHDESRTWSTTAWSPICSLPRPIWSKHSGRPLLKPKMVGNSEVVSASGRPFRSTNCACTTLLIGVQ
jgi:hypothetical protein